MFNIVMYAAAIGSLLYSYSKDKQKTKKCILVAKKSFLNILPDLLALFMVVSIALTIIPPAAISKAVGGQSGFWGMLIAASVGALTLIPGMIAFPLAKSLLDLGAGISQVVVFISTLMMVGLATMPLEIRYFGKQQTLLRNSLAFIYSFLLAALVGGILA